MKPPHPAPLATSAIAAEPGQMLRLAQACQSLWSATLSLMVAFMQSSAPAHRLMLARRIARNFETLSEQPCFGEATRSSFSRLHARWTSQAKSLTPGDEQSGAVEWMRKLLPH